MPIDQVLSRSLGTAGELFSRLASQGVYFILPDEGRFGGGFMLAARSFEGIRAGQAEHENILANMDHFVCLVWAMWAFRRAN